MGVWIVGETELLSAAWYLDGTEVSTGSATVSVAIVRSGVVNYLSSDLTSLTTTPTELSLSYSAENSWNRLLTIPSSMVEGNVYIVYIHSDAALTPIPDKEFYVSFSNLDDAVGPGAEVGA